MKYFITATLIGWIGAECMFLPYLGFDIYPSANFLIFVYTLVMSYAFVRHHLLDINVVFRTSFIYSVLVAIITSVYFVFVFLTEQVFKGVMGYRSIFISVSSAFAIALIFNPIKNKIQHLADRIFLGKDPMQIAQENELLRQELLRSERLKTAATLASGIAHEIKNPLTAIKTFAEYLPQKRDDKEFLEKFSKIVGSEVEKIDDLVHQLLDYSKPAPLQLKEADIHKLIDDTLDLLSNQFIKYNISVVKEYNANLRESSAVGGSAFGGNANGREYQISDNSRSISDNLRLIIKIDPQQMKQVFLNLFLNAIEAMPNGGTLTVSTNLCSSGGNKSVIICVKDTGCGISEKDLPHIFEPFYSTKEKGSGLGLSIVYNIIKEHEGTITSESTVKSGTRFIIKLLIKNT